MEQEKGFQFNSGSVPLGAKILFGEGQDPAFIAAEARLADASKRIFAERDRVFAEEVKDRVAKGMARLVDALEQQLNPTYRRISELEQRLSRYDRAFEEMFREELDSRINGKARSMDGAACSISPLAKLKFELQNESANRTGRSE